MRVVLLCKYDGSRYHGFQIQPNNNTVQAEIEKSLKKIHKKDIRIYMSGRTDSGVHAYGQVLHFDTELNIPSEAWIKAINANLPKDIRIFAATISDNDFHVRYNSVEKTYIYKLYLGREVDPFLINYVGQHSFDFDFSKAQNSLKYFIGEHDFSSFCSKNSSVEDKVRTIYNFTMERDKIDSNIINFEITGNGFLYNMVRIIIGTIQDVAKGKYKPEYISEIISKKERQFAGPKADAQGLYLKEVIYDSEEINNFIKREMEN
ncbi:tRNA pseudouridine(38-40) synthase TruA [Gemella cuniculi]|uniref:tRNA pseudouridine(38-40) synthase TruA n=1 Tax=Gemella cuniculi TaxID=150240 RepID=UPI0004148786|nr:tRNA pseudouridine(38-40) synthase TruA [Gemella cuniculi]